MNTNNIIGMPCNGMSREELIAIAQSLLRLNTKFRDERMSLIISKRGLKACYDNLSEQYKELEDENAKLREQVTRLQADWESERDYANQMEAKEKQAVGENDKLREQVENLTHEYERLMNENIKLRELSDCTKCVCGLESYIDPIVDPFKAENAKLHEFTYER